MLAEAPLALRNITLSRFVGRNLPTATHHSLCGEKPTDRHSLLPPNPVTTQTSVRSCTSISITSRKRLASSGPVPRMDINWHIRSSSICFRRRGRNPHSVRFLDYLFDSEDRLQESYELLLKRCNIRFVPQSQHPIRPLGRVGLDRCNGSPLTSRRKISNDHVDRTPRESIWGIANLSTAREHQTRRIRSGATEVVKHLVPAPRRPANCPVELRGVLGLSCLPLYKI